VLYWCKSNSVILLLLIATGNIDTFDQDLIKIELRNLFIVTVQSADLKKKKLFYLYAVCPKSDLTYKCSLYGLLCTGYHFIACYNGIKVFVLIVFYILYEE
jgi:hypothetical protein